MFGFLAQATQLTREDVVQIVKATQESSVTEIASQVVIIIVGVIGLPSFIMFIIYVMRRMQAGEVRFTKIDASIASITKDVQHAERLYERSIETIQNMDRRLDEQQLLAAETRKDVKHMAMRMDEFFTDAKPGRGFTSKVKKALREIVKPDSLIRPDMTIHPEDPSAAAPGASVSFTRTPSKPALKALRNDTPVPTHESIAGEHDDTEQVVRPTKPLMRPKSNQRPTQPPHRMQQQQMNQKRRG